jgi:hypothetical protein
MNDDPIPRIDSRAGFTAALRWAFERSIERHARRIVCADPSFNDWPLDDPALLTRLTAWLRTPQRKLVLLATQFDDLPRRQPRFVGWRVDWVHAVEAWSPPEEDRVEMPTVMVDDDSTSVELIDAVHWKGHADIDSRIARLWRERIDALLQRSEPALPVNRLGL